MYSRKMLLLYWEFMAESEKQLLLEHESSNEIKLVLTCWHGFAVYIYRHNAAIC